MKNILNYLQTNIDDKAEIQKWNAKEYLNFQLAGNYEYYLVYALAESFLLIKPMEEFTISKTKIHIKRISEKTGYEVAILLQAPTTYRTKKMIEERIPFVTVDRQMFLPFLALHIKQSRAKGLDVAEREKFTPATQMLYIFILYSDKRKFDTDELAKTLNISSMTILRGMQELSRIGIIEEEIAGKTGRKKVYTPIDKRKYYQVGKQYLINPVKKSIYVKNLPNNVKVYRAGMTALAEQTMLGELTNEVFATVEKQTLFSKYMITKMQALSEGLPEVQIMQYDIGKLTKNQYLDPVSLIMSINKKDDRTEIAIDELMKGFAWYEV